MINEILKIISNNLYIFGRLLFNFFVFMLIFLFFVLSFNVGGDVGEFISRFMGKNNDNYRH